MVNQIILSCNEDPVYMEFWKPVSQAYKKMFPNVKVHLAFLTNRDENDPLVKEFREYGEVTLFKPLPDIPEFGQAKMIRFILASQQGNDVCYIDDIDLFPLSKDFIADKLIRRPWGVLLCVGGEVYGFNGCYPISQMTAEGNVWKKFINPRSESYDVILRSFKDRAFYDFRENIMIETDYSKDRYFSDERLLKRLLVENPVPKLELKRGYYDYLDATIDRHTLNKETDVWEFDKEKLKNHGYVNCHGARPYSKYKDYYIPMIEYIENNYGK
jgi:hypothetical protein